MSSFAIAIASIVAETAAIVTNARDSATGSEVELPLRLDQVPAMLQFALDAGVLQRSHVAYQSMVHGAALLCAFGMESTVPDGHFDNLLQFASTQDLLFGAGCPAFMHGPGDSPHDPASYVDAHNSGQHSSSAIARVLPGCDILGGPQFTDILNFHAAIKDGGGKSVTYSPVDGSVVTLCAAGFDGLLLGIGDQVDEGNLQVIGHENPVGFEEARRVLAMEDEAAGVWLKEHPHVEECRTRSTVATLLPPAGA